ncbi:MAG: hypothetical protein RRY80_03420, partial [Lachnospiraceae bacterium]
ERHIDRLFQKCEETVRHVKNVSILKFVKADVSKIVISMNRQVYMKIIFVRHIKSFLIIATVG